MRPEVVVVGDVLSQDTAEVLFAEHDDAVGALASEGADYPLDERVRRRRANGSLDGLDPDPPRPRREVAAVAAVRSRMRKRGAVPQGVAWMICRQTQSAVGCAVTLKCTMRRRSWARAKKT